MSNSTAIATTAPPIQVAGGGSCPNAHHTHNGARGSSRFPTSAALAAGIKRLPRVRRSKPSPNWVVPKRASQMNSIPVRFAGWATGETAIAQAKAERHAAGSIETCRCLRMMTIIVAISTVIARASRFPTRCPAVSAARNITRYAEQGQDARAERGPALPLPYPEPSHRRRDERGGGVDDGDVSDRGLAQCMNEADRGDRRAGACHETGPADRAEGADGGRPMAPDDIGADEQATEYASPEQDGPDIGRDEAGEQSGGAERDSRCGDQQGSEPSLGARFLQRPQCHALDPE